MSDFTTQLTFKVLEESTGSEFPIDIEDVPTWKVPGYVLKQFTGKHDSDGQWLYGGDTIQFQNKKPGDTDVITYDTGTAEWYAGKVLLSQAARHVTKV